MAANGESHWWYRNTRALLRQLIEPHLGHHTEALHLDAGGGTGATGAWLTQNAPTVVADFDHFALEVAREDHPGYLPALADLNHLPFDDDAFSAVLCVTALCHRMVPDPGAVVRDFARLTRPGGVVALMEPGGKHLWRSHDDVTHTGRRFSIGELRSLATDAGLEIITATGAYVFLVPPAFILGKIERGKVKSDVGRNETGVGGLFGMLARLERRAMRRWSLPSGLSVIVVARKPG